MEEEERGLFTENDLINAVNAAIEYFIKVFLIVVEMVTIQANFYESAITLYRFLIPIYEKNNSYGSLSHVFDECGKLYTRITELVESKAFLTILGRYKNAWKILQSWILRN